MSGRTGDRSSLPRAALHILSWNSLRFGGTLSFQDILFLARLAQRSLDFKRTFKIHKSIPTGLKLFSLAQVFTPGTDSVHFTNLLQEVFRWSLAGRATLNRIFRSPINGAELETTTPAPRRKRLG